MSMTTIVLLLLAAVVAMIAWRQRKLSTLLHREVEMFDRRLRDFDRRMGKGMEELRQEFRSLARPKPRDEVNAAEGCDESRKLEVVKAIKQVYDPEIPVNVYDLGLIYEVLVTKDDRVNVKMSLTSPTCPSAQALPAEIERRIKTDVRCKEVSIDLVWEPAWGPHLISEAGRLQLGLD